MVFHAAQPLYNLGRGLPTPLAAQSGSTSRPAGETVQESNVLQADGEQTGGDCEQTGDYFEQTGMYCEKTDDYCEQTGNICDLMFKFW